MNDELWRSEGLSLVWEFERDEEDIEIVVTFKKGRTGMMMEDLLLSGSFLSAARRVTLVDVVVLSK